MASRKRKRFTAKYRKIKKSIGTKKIHIVIAVVLMISILTAVIFCIVYFLQNKSAKEPVTKNTTISNITVDMDNITDNITVDNQTVLISSKPKLVIIVDDVTFPKQLGDILSIPLKITPSFLPPTKKSNFSDKLAQKTEFYMVHLPLEAMNFKSPEEETLLVSDSYDVILKKLKKLKAQFPHAIYYNNHTGSKFTADIEAMRRLIEAMDELDLIFVDSRTIAKTKAPEIFAEQGKKLLQRDVFLDNVIEKEAIKTQLLIVVEKAKERGFAIAIGHPHKETMEALKEFAKKCDEVEVVYIKDL
ncbi:MAG: divergent polysaccharide deacetylase family protein [Campylobacteraceae bacterium]|nr:divergent polysaccharide deacetylase family protein [Campylobacteraceae bacterium]